MTARPGTVPAVKWLALAAVALALTALPAQAAVRADSASLTIRLLSTNGKATVVVDRTPKSVPSKGDVVRETTTLRNAVRQFGKARGAIVGSDVAVYTFLSSTAATVRVTARLPGGTLRATARVEGTAQPVLRVVGGTGAFAGARGTGRVAPAPEGVKGVLNIYRLQLP
jgi:hypothetical protein